MNSLSSKPFAKKSFYIDLKGFPNEKKLIADLELLGGKQEVFLSKSVSFVVSNTIPSTEYGSPPLFSAKSISPYLFKDSGFANTDSPASFSPTFEQKLPTEPSVPMSRAMSILQKAREKRQGSNKVVIDLCKQWNIKVYPVQKVLSWVEKYKSKYCKHHSSKPKENLTSVNVQRIYSPFIKIEDKNRKYRPKYKASISWSNVADATLLQSVRQIVKNVKQFGNINTFTRSALKEIPAQCQFSSQLSRNRSVSLTKTTGYNSSKVNTLNSSKQAGYNSILNSVSVSGPVGKNPRSHKTKKEKHAKRKKQYCEICAAHYSDADAHFNKQSHVKYQNNAVNYEAVQNIIKTLPQVDDFLNSVYAEERVEKETPKDSIEVEESRIENSDNPLDESCMTEEYNFDPKDFISASCSSAGSPLPYLGKTNNCHSTEDVNLGFPFLYHDIFKTDLKCNAQNILEEPPLLLHESCKVSLEKTVHNFLGDTIFGLDNMDSNGSSLPNVLKNNHDISFPDVQIKLASLPQNLENKLNITNYEFARPLIEEQSLCQQPVTNMANYLASVDVRSKQNENIICEVPISLDNFSADKVKDINTLNDNFIYAVDIQSQSLTHGNSINGVGTLYCNTDDADTEIDSCGSESNSAEFDAVITNCLEEVTKSLEKDVSTGEKSELNNPLQFLNSNLVPVSLEISSNVNKNKQQEMEKDSFIGESEPNNPLQSLNSNAAPIFLEISSTVNKNKQQEKDGSTVEKSEPNNPLQLLNSTVAPIFLEISSNMNKNKQQETKKDGFTDEKSELNNPLWSLDSNVAPIFLEISSVKENKQQEKDGSTVEKSEPNNPLQLLNSNVAPIFLEISSNMNENRQQKTKKDGFTGEKSEPNNPLQSLNSSVAPIFLEIFSNGNENKQLEKDGSTCEKSELNNPLKFLNSNVAPIFLEISSNNENKQKETSMVSLGDSFPKNRSFEENLVGNHAMIYETCSKLTELSAVESDTVITASQSSCDSDTYFFRAETTLSSILQERLSIIAGEKSAADQIVESNSENNLNEPMNKKISETLPNISFFQQNCSLNVHCENPAKIDNLLRLTNLLATNIPSEILYSDDAYLVLDEADSFSNSINEVSKNEMLVDCNKELSNGDIVNTTADNLDIMHNEMEYSNSCSVCAEENKSKMCADCNKIFSNANVAIETKNILETQHNEMEYSLITNNDNIKEYSHFYPSSITENQSEMKYVLENEQNGMLYSPSTNIEEIHNNRIKFSINTVSETAEQIKTEVAEINNKIEYSLSINVKNADNKMEFADFKDKGECDYKKIEYSNIDKFRTGDHTEEDNKTELKCYILNGMKEKHEVNCEQNVYLNCVINSKAGEMEHLSYTSFKETKEIDDCNKMECSNIDAVSNLEKKGEDYQEVDIKNSFNINGCKSERSEIYCNEMEYLTTDIICEVQEKEIVCNKGEYLCEVEENTEIYCSKIEHSISDAYNIVQDRRTEQKESDSSEIKHSANASTINEGKFNLNNRKYTLNDILMNEIRDKDDTESSEKYLPSTDAVTDLEAQEREIVCKKGEYLCEIKENTDIYCNKIEHVTSDAYNIVHDKKTEQKESDSSEIKYCTNASTIKEGEFNFNNMKYTLNESRYKDDTESSEKYLPSTDTVIDLEAQERVIVCNKGKYMKVKENTDIYCNKIEHPTSDAYNIVQGRRTEQQGSDSSEIKYSVNASTINEGEFNLTNMKYTLNDISVNESRDKDDTESSEKYSPSMDAITDLQAQLHISKTNVSGNSSDIDAAYLGAQIHISKTNASESSDVSSVSSANNSINHDSQTYESSFCSSNESDSSFLEGIIPINNSSVSGLQTINKPVHIVYISSPILPSETSVKQANQMV